MARKVKSRLPGDTLRVDAVSHQGSGFYHDNLVKYKSGFAHPTAKVTPEQRAGMRADYLAGATVETLAAKYQVSITTVIRHLGQHYRVRRPRA